MEPAITGHEAVDHDDLLVHMASGTAHPARHPGAAGRDPRRPPRLASDRPAGAARLAPQLALRIVSCWSCDACGSCSTCCKIRSAWWMPRWMEPVIPHLHLEASPAAEEAAPRARAHRRLRPPSWATRRAVPTRPRPGGRTPALTPGKPGSRHPRARGNQAGVAMGPRTRRLPGQGVTAAARTGSSW